MGPIQTAIGQALGAIEATVAVGKKLQNDERQASEKQAAEAEKMEKAQRTAEAEKQKAEGEQSGNQDLAEKAVKLAQDQKLASPRSILFDEHAKPLASYDELAAVLSRNSLAKSLESKKRTKNRLEERRKRIQQRLKQASDTISSKGKGRAERD